MYEGQKGSGSQKRVANLTRNGYLGQQRYSTILWSGDISATWDTFKNQIPAGLNFCASGLPYWTLDSGAFFVKNGVQWFWDGDYPDGNDDLGYRELATRWYQYAAFIPIFRGHGTDVRRELWEHAGDGGMFYESMVQFNKLRYSLMPYIYSVAGQVWEEDGTMMKMLAFDFPNDEKALNIKDQFMFGPSIMVCPVTQPMYYDKNSAPIEGAEKSRTVYLPEGCDWYDYWSGEKISGGQFIKADAPIEKMPLYIKAGSIIVMCEPGNYVNENPNAPWTVNVYPGADAKFTLYEDEGDGYGYEQGEYMKRTITWNEAEKKAEIGTPTGEYKNACKDRQFKINLK
jgi:alpha-D-xyloside xylohydrolase